MATKVEERELGISFEVPEGWKYRKMQTGYLFGHATLEGLLLLLFHYNSTLEAMKNDMEVGFYDNSGFNLQVQGGLNVISDTTVIAEYEGSAQGQPAKGYSIGLLSPHGGGVLIAAIAHPDNFTENYLDFVDDIARAIEFFEPEQGSAGEEWEIFLKNKVLDNREGENIRARKIKYHLHENGTFTAFGDVRSNQFIAEYEASEGKTSGQWEVVDVMDQPILSLTYFDGTEKQYSLNYEDGEIYLNNEHWSINDIC